MYGLFHGSRSEQTLYHFLCIYVAHTVLFLLLRGITGNQKKRRKSACFKTHVNYESF